jgi:hypothetical protein
MKTENEEKKKKKRDKKMNQQVKRKSISAPKVSQSELTDCSYSVDSSLQSANDSENSASETETVEDIIPSPPRHDKALKVPPTPSVADCSKSPTSAVDRTKDACGGKLPTITQCETHTNKTNTDDVHDIRRKTRSQRIASNNNDGNLKWKGISTTTSKRVTKLQHAVISPLKRTGKVKNCDKTSPNYNRYDPDGLITKKNSDDENDSDHPIETHRILRSGKRT